MKKLIGILFASFVMIGCVGEEPAAPSSTAEVAEAAEAVESASPSAKVATWEENGAPKPGDGVSIQANCSIVQYCDRPNSAEGTVCLQQSGCTFQAAANECAAESVTVCGTPKCPWILVGTDGVRYNHYQCF